MCEPTGSKTTYKDGTCSVDLVCATSGKPFTIVNKYGMFCEDLCDLDGCIKGFDMTEQWIDDFIKMAGLED